MNFVKYVVNYISSFVLIDKVQTNCQGFQVFGIQFNLHSSEQ